MSLPQDKKQIVFTNRAKCRDCYRCIRVCPVGAIGIRNGQAFVDEQRCISCGTCIRECPQQAKSYRNDLAEVKDLLKSGRQVAVSIAPSFACLFESWQLKRIPSMLRRLGFCYAAETSIGAALVSEAGSNLISQHRRSSYISTACPAVVRYILKYRPELKDFLMPVLSPMLAHAKCIKSELGSDTAVVFIGPCVAKKYEAENDGEHLVDAVLSFTELLQWFEDENLSASDFEESDFDRKPPKAAIVYPLQGGGLKTSSLEPSVFDTKVVAVSGFEALCDVLDCIADGSADCIFEPLFCSQGCINGPLVGTDKPLFKRRRAVLDYFNSCPEDTEDSGQDIFSEDINLSCKFTIASGAEEEFTEEQIRKVLDKTGKSNPQDQLNCGACGYPSCRQQAIAVLRNMAEADMCIPYVRKLAEQRTDKIIETSPNGIIVLDKSLCILHMNSSFRKLFMCTDSVLGKPLSYLIDTEPFEKVASGQMSEHQSIVKHSKYSLICKQIVYFLPQDGQIVGLFVDLTRMTHNRHKYNQLQLQTLEQAKALLEHQTEMAGKFAEYLGSSSAQSEKLLVNLIKIAQGDLLSDENDKGDSKWLNNIYTPK